jgi:hypothetical protein
MMKLIMMYILLMALTITSASANTIYVRSNGTGNYTSIAAAINAAQSSDTIVIDDNAVYSESAQAAPAASVTSVTLVAATGKTPTWDFTVQGVASPAFILQDGTGWSIEGIKFVYTGPEPTTAPAWTCAIRVAGNSPVITKCTFMGTMGAAIYYSNAGAANPGVDLSYCSFYLLDPDTSVAVDIYAAFWGALYTGSFEVEHCTFGCNGVSGGGNRILLWDNNGAAGNTIKVKNSLFFGNELGFWCADLVGGSNMSIEYVVSSTSAHWPAWMGTVTNLGNNTTSADSKVSNPASGDFSLLAGSPALNVASDGSNVGSWQTPAAGPNTLYVRADGSGNYTSIAAAVNAAQSSNTIVIDDNSVYSESVQAAPAASVTNVTLKAAAGKTPTWDFTVQGAMSPAFVLQNGAGWSIEGIKFVYTGPEPTTTPAWTCAIRVAGNSPRITGCTFMGTMGAAIYYSNAGAANPGVDLSYCSFYLLDPDNTVAVDIYAIFWGAVYTGSIEIEHCTIGCNGVSGGGNRILLWDNNGTAGNTIEIKNSLFFGNELGYWCADAVGGSNMSVEYVVSSASAHWPAWMGTITDLGNNTATPDSKITDPANGDFTLQPGSPAINAASDGTNAGSSPIVVPVELSDFAVM